MNETLSLVLAWIAGGMIGAVFFGGLWWTVRKALSSPHAALWFIGSLMIRMSIAFTGFYVVGRDHWQRLLAALFGFVLARIIVMRLTGSKLADHASSPSEIHNAP